LRGRLGGSGKFDEIANGKVVEEGNNWRLKFEER